MLKDGLSGFWRPEFHNLLTQGVYIQSSQGRCPGPLPGAYSYPHGDLEDLERNA